MESDELKQTLRQALSLLANTHSSFADRFRFAAQKVLEPTCNILVSGLCSVGKSSFVGALWGDSEMLPTAVRDCTQTNTLLRVPAPDEADRRILLAYLSRAEALDYATRDLSFYRVATLLSEINGPLGPRLDEMPAEQRLRFAVVSLRQIFKTRPDLFVLHEPLTSELDKLEQFLEFLDSPEFRPGETITAHWEDRREHLMGRLREDGRTLDTGKLLALRHVEMARRCDMWPASLSPHLIDSPWIPTYHNARRADLILKQARNADVLVILALPDRFKLEPWVFDIYRERPELLMRTVIVFNQIDTVDTSVLFSREGFAAAYRENVETLVKLGLREENIFMACARLQFLKLAPQDNLTPKLMERLKGVLEKIARLAEARPDSEFKRKLLSVCKADDGGVGTVRNHLNTLSLGPVTDGKAMEARRALNAINPLELPDNIQNDWRTILSKTHPPGESFSDPVRIAR